MPKKVKVSPTKAFFVRMITRDITLEDSILDLIDNSVDGAWKNEGSRPAGLAENVDLKKYQIEITANETEFSISDNCGGMSLEDAVEYAFSFGRREDDPTDEFSIGVYGIGMKRAVFKLGENISIHSTTNDQNGDRLGFRVPIDVNDWLTIHDGPWDFDLVPDNPEEQTGVRIAVTNLTRSTKVAFGNPAFIQQLARVISRDYALHLNQGLNILVNGKKVTGWEITFKSSDEFEPVRFDFVDEADGQPVSVEIIGGMAEVPPDGLEPDERGRKQDPYGWYIVCNGRIVLAADKTEISGWGDAWPKWHPQYAGFIGLLVFSAKSAADLPLTTTKRSVDRASGVFRRSRPHLGKISQTWIDYTNKRKTMNRAGDEKQEEVKKLENATVPVSVYAVQPKAAMILPKFSREVRGEKQANIAYSVPVSKARALARGLGNQNLSYREIGLQSFEYAFEDLAGDD
ncbi:ATP-binding protein [Ascidiaceihabitans donghaensis]|nr:ATP-binding protein [Ascidiaceihabitans donghaensis]